MIRSAAARRRALGGLIVLLMSCGGCSGGGDSSPPPAPPAPDVDASFGTNGVVDVGFTVTTFALQADGKIVVAGQAGAVNGTFDLALARYDTNGRPDPGFGSNGRVTTDVQNTSYDSVNALAIQDDSKVVVAGNSFAIDFDNIALARYDARGTLDASFGGAGTVVTDVDRVPDATQFGGRLDQALSVFAQPGGGLIVLAHVSFGGPFTGDLVLLRYADDGALDPGFGVGGTVSLNLSGDTSKRVFLQGQADGHFTVLMTRQDPPPSGQANGRGFVTVQRYSPTGGLESELTFDDGFVPTSLAEVTSNRLDDLKLQADGKLVAVELVAQGIGGFISLVRFNADGTLDATFGNNGRLNGLESDRFPTAAPIAFQPDGKALIGGVIRGTVSSRLFLDRIDASGRLDPTFGNGGRRQPLVAPSMIAVQPDGKILVLGENKLIRYLP